MNNHELATIIAQKLFTNGAGVRARRLVHELPNGYNGGGWGEEPMRDYVERMLNEHQPEYAAVVEAPQKKTGKRRRA